MLLTFLFSLALQAPGGPKLSVVRGRVTAADTGAPLKRAQVSLRDGFNTISAVTDADGRYEIPSVDPGKYEASCLKSGYVTATHAQTLEVAGQEVSDVNFSLQRAGVISGKVTDEDGEPIVNAMLQAIVRSYRPSRPPINMPLITNTDDQGVYRLHDLPPGRYYVQASYFALPGRPNLHFVPVIYPNAARLSEGQAIRVAAGADVPDIDFRMRDAKVYTVSGKVVDTRTGQPPAGVSVALVPEELIPSALGIGTSILYRYGAFHLTGVVAGRYQLVANVQGVAPTAGGYSTKTLEVTGDLSDVTFYLGPGATVRGQLRAEGGDLPKQLTVRLVQKVGDGAFHSIGVPINRNVSLGNIDVRTHSGSALTKPDGSFEISGVQPGEYDFSVRREDGSGTFALTPKMFFVRDTVVGRQNIGDSYVNVPENAATVEISATLDFRTGSISGQLTDAADPDGKPPAPTEVAMIPADPKRRAVESYYRHARSDASGNFQVFGLVPGDYLLVPWDAPDIFAVMDLDIFAQLEKLAVSVSVTASGAATQDLKITRELRGLAQATLQ